MANTVQNKNEIFLGSNHFKIAGGVRKSLVSAFPQKLITGEYDYANQQLLSPWTISDQRGGIGIEEMDETAHADRCWWSTCILSYRRNITLPRLATAMTKSIYTASAYNQATNWTDPDSGWGDEDNAIDGDTGTKAGCNVADSGKYIYIYFPAMSASKLRYYWSEFANDDVDDLEIGAYYGGAWNVVVSDDSQGEGALAEASLGDTYTVTALRLKFTLSGGAGYLHVLELYAESADMQGTPKCFENFNGELYVAWKNSILKLNAGGTGFDAVSWAYSVDIEQIIASLNSCLYVYLGDTENYWYMSTAEAFTQTDVTDATMGIEWDSKLWKMDGDGNWWYATTPNAASPAWTSRAGISSIDSGDVKRLFIGRDADGNDVVYAATTSVLKTYDSANNLWLDTSVKLPDHPNGGMGAVTWRDGTYISYGLDVLKYVPGSTATITPMGPSRNDGIPTEYNGEITRFVEGDNDLFALVDSSQTSGNTTSSILSWDGVGWQVFWAADDYVLPTGNSDPGAAWTDETKAYDDNINTYAYTNQTGEYLVLTIASTCCSAIRVMADEYLGAAIQGTSDASIDVYYNASWHNVHSGALNVWPYWTIIPIDTRDDVTQVRIKANSITHDYLVVFEVELYGHTYNGTTGAGIVSSAYSYSLYFDHDDTVYQIPLYRGIRNPIKLPSSFTYHPFGNHITPWFDAGSAVESKTAKYLHVYCNNMTSEDTILAYYRIDHSNTDLDTGWTALGSGISSDGTTEIEFGTSGEGVAFKEIQIRLILTNYTSTNKPTLTGAVLEYIKLTKKNWGYSFTVDCSEEYNSLSPKEQLEALETAAEATTLQEFTYRNESDGTETKYVLIHPFGGIEKTGDDYRGRYNVTVVEP